MPDPTNVAREGVKSVTNGCSIFQGQLSKQGANNALYAHKNLLEEIKEITCSSVSFKSEN